MLDSLVELWEMLASFACRQSLLLMSNLVLDENRVLGLKRIYWEPENSQITLPDLGKLWEKLFEQSQETQDGALLILHRDIKPGNLLLHRLDNRIFLIDFGAARGNWYSSRYSHWRSGL